ncbi:MAG TPA: LuxR C-terminal-related transcriptional regulator [Polyangiaceae bacterium]|jgi:DNA-binding CsgD family transcriptional regulator
MQKPSELSEILQAYAVSADEATAEPIDLALLWRELVNGEVRVTQSFASEERCYLVLERGREHRTRARIPQSRKIRILESLFFLGAQKNVALEFGVSLSSVAGVTKECLLALGLPCKPSRVSPLVIAAAHAARGDSIVCWGRASQFSHAGATYRVVSFARPDSDLARYLTPAQYEVVRLRVEGMSHTEIAVSRHRSRRTIANQLAESFRRLGVSGRAELIRCLITQPQAVLGRKPTRRRGPPRQREQAPLSA